MAVGSIPIINYGRLFDPPLEDMKTCIAFATRAELKEKIQMALQMPDLRIIEMQANVCRYYDENLAPDAFYRKWRKALANQRTVRVHNSTVAGRESYLNTLWGHDAEN